MGCSAPAWAASPSAESSLPPLARAQAERIAAAQALQASQTPPSESRFDPAPIPNQDLAAPRSRTVSSGPVFGPHLFRQEATYRGDGYIVGSTEQTTQAPRHLPLPGIGMKMPLN
jgi:hypothetical protein